MTDNDNAYNWSISAIGATRPYRCGAATARGEAWLQALGAGRAALLTGELADLAVTVDDTLPAVLYSPRRDVAGALDAAAVTEALVGVHQRATAFDVAIAVAGTV